MALQFDFIYSILSDSDAQMSTDTQWIASTYGAQVIRAFGGSSSKVVEGTLRFTTFNDMWAAILAFKAQFTSSLTVYDYEVAQEGV